VGDTTFLKTQLLLATQAGAVLDRQAGAGKPSALFAAVTRLDGAFGFTEKGVSKPATAGLCGLIKTAAMEWEAVSCRAIDVSPDLREASDVGRRLCTELLNPAVREDREVGLGAGGRVTLSLASAPYGEADEREPALTREDVFIVTGGARGVTAASALALARVAPLTLVLLGRSEAPFKEPEWLSSCGAANEMKRAILQNEFGGQAPSPRTLEAAYRRYAANREMSDTLSQISAAGGRVRYHQVDVRNREAVFEVLEGVRKNEGPISGILHGAGVVEDRLIIEKTPDQAARVLETKITGLQHLLDATAEDPLRFLILFSSVAARFGNRGQADYAMANEVLNKIAVREAALRPDCRVAAINWGPWDGGMVTESLKRAFEKRRIGLIPLEAGARCLVRELSQTGASAPPEVVVGSAIGDTGAGAPTAKVIVASPPPRAELSLLFKREIDMARLPVLASHLLDGIPVVPFALMAEWIGHGAMHANPGLQLLGFDDLRLLKGIRIEEQMKTIRLMAGKAKKRGDAFEVDVEIRNGVVDGADVIHSRARALLAHGLPEAPVLPADFVSRFAPYEKSVREVYDDILFHGADLQGIRRIIGLSEAGMAAEISAAPEPEKWMADPLRTRWISDPLALDGAFQMACLWCHEKMGAVSLPSYTARYRQFCRTFPEEGVTAVMEVVERHPHKMTGDFTFIDTRGAVIATLTGYEAVVDPSLYRAFKPERQRAAAG
jgi:NAD(P)-dependent dehydrogenase (short-subunit alcohol dehydrogenase family)